MKNGKVVSAPKINALCISLLWQGKKRMNLHAESADYMMNDIFKGEVLDGLL